MLRFSCLGFNIVNIVYTENAVGPSNTYLFWNFYWDWQEPESIVICHSLKLLKGAIDIYCINQMYCKPQL